MIQIIEVYVNQMNFKIIICQLIAENLIVFSLKILDQKQHLMYYSKSTRILLTYHLRKQ